MELPVLLRGNELIAGVAYRAKRRGAPKRLADGLALLGALLLQMIGCAQHKHRRKREHPVASAKWVE